MSNYVSLEEGKHRAFPRKTAVTASADEWLHEVTSAGTPEELAFNALERF